MTDGIRQSPGVGLVGLYGSTSALATTLTLTAFANCVGTGFQRGNHARWHVVADEASGAPTLIGAGTAFALPNDAVITLTIAAAPNAGSVWVRRFDEASGAMFEQEITADVPAAAQFLNPRLYMNNGTTAAAVAFDCSGVYSGVYMETDYRGAVDRGRVDSSASRFDITRGKISSLLFAGDGPALRAHGRMP